ncbi:hypothetical protein [Desulfatiglans anilini]|uniref:hypothetical protein n=1 Tax=Desulfatiglans anilini TaxID=90728 RepID=UPI00040DFD69|nr:hypothetical protein [Desulfatiglans anilini]
MKKGAWMVLWGVLFFASVAAKAAVDISDIDRVSVSMSRSEVCSILGEPDEISQMGELKIELYHVTGASPLMSAGYIYEDEAMLGGHAFVFHGDLKDQSARLLREAGFTLLDPKGDLDHLEGKDDDTGRPVVIAIDVNDGLTTITAFEKGFYERKVNR